MQSAGSRSKDLTEGWIFCLVSGVCIRSFHELVAIMMMMKK